MTVNATTKCHSLYRRTLTAELPVSNSSHVTVNATAKCRSIYRRTVTAELPVESSSALSHLSFRPSSSGPPPLEAEESASLPRNPQ